MLAKKSYPLPPPVCVYNCFSLKKKQNKSLTLTRMGLNNNRAFQKPVKLVKWNKPIIVVMRYTQVHSCEQTLKKGLERQKGKQINVTMVTSE
jgi:hypothetical protein